MNKPSGFNAITSVSDRMRGGRNKPKTIKISGLDDRIDGVAIHRVKIWIAQTSPSAEIPARP